MKVGLFILVFSLFRQAIAQRHFLWHANRVEAAVNMMRFACARQSQIRQQIKRCASNAHRVRIILQCTGGLVEAEHMTPRANTRSGKRLDRSS